jgi:hypothetical protein
MGQIIELEQWRRKQPQPAAATPERVVWPNLPAAYVETVVLPSMAMWRSLAASCACWWLAPLGLEVRPIDPTPPAPGTERLSSTR